MILALDLTLVFAEQGIQLACRRCGGVRLVSGRCSSELRGVVVKGIDGDVDALVFIQVLPCISRPDSAHDQYAICEEASNHHTHEAPVTPQNWTIFSSIFLSTIADDSDLQAWIVHVRYGYGLCVECPGGYTWGPG